MGYLDTLSNVVAYVNAAENSAWTTFNDVDSNVRIQTVPPLTPGSLTAAAPSEDARPWLINGNSIFFPDRANGNTTRLVYDPSLWDTGDAAAGSLPFTVAVKFLIPDPASVVGDVGGAVFSNDAGGRNTEFQVNNNTSIVLLVKGGSVQTDDGAGGLTPLATELGEIYQYDVFSTMILTCDPATNSARVVINGTLYDNLTINGTDSDRSFGMAFGARIQNIAFKNGEIQRWVGTQSYLTPQEALDMDSFLNDELGTVEGTITYASGPNAGSPINGMRVFYGYGDDEQLTNFTVVEEVVTGADGKHALTAAIPAGKVAAYMGHYKDGDGKYWTIPLKIPNSFLP